MEAWVWALILLVIGLIIIAIEMFVPSGGILGVLSAVAILGAIILAFVSSLKFGAFMLILVSLMLPAIFAAAIRYWPDTPMGRLIMIRPPSSDDVLPNAEGRRNLQSLIGRRGVAKCQMLPGGVVVVDGTSYDAVTDGTPVEIGQPVQVVAVSMNRLEVRLDDRPEPESPRAMDVATHPAAAGPPAPPTPPAAPADLAATTSALPETATPSVSAPPNSPASAPPSGNSGTVEDVLSRPIESLGLESLDDPLM